MSRPAPRGRLGIAALLALLAPLPSLTARDARAEEFSYRPAGELVAGSGTGRADEKVYAPGMRFPMESGPAFANSQVYGHGGGSGPGGGQCDAPNYSYPWRDNYCEKRSWDMPLCPSGTGHQGQDIRPATCKKDVHWVVAAADGKITNVGSYSVYLTANDGTRYDYLHMSNVQVGVGQSVKRGQRIGLVSNLFNGTPTTIHLHLNIKQNVANIGFIFVPPYMSLVTSYQELVGPVNKAPVGHLDAVGCKGIRGWAQDPDAPKDPIQVHLYLDSEAGQPGAKALSIKADAHRGDLCEAIGSCEHGFAVPSPLSLLDGEAHVVHAYGIDTAGGQNPELKDSPRELKCAIELPEGVRRHLGSKAAYDAWKFSALHDVLSVPDAKLEAYPDGTSWPDAPELVRADDGSPEVYLRDGAYRRHVADRAVAAAWDLDPDAADALPSAELEAMPLGAPLRERPFLLKGSGPGLYAIDDPPPEAGSSGSSGGDGPGSSGAGAEVDSGAGGDSPKEGGPNGALGGDVGCACRTAPGDRAPRTFGAFGALGLSVLGAAFRARRRPRRPAT